MGTKFSVTESTLIDRPLEEVFAYVTDYRNDVHWRQGVTAMAVEPEESTRVGTRTKEVMRAYGRVLHTEAEITSFVQNQRSDFRAINGPMPVSGSRTVESRGKQTLFTYSIAGELDPFFSLIWPLMRKSYQRQIAGDLQRLKQVLEAAAPKTAAVFAAEQ